MVLAVGNTLWTACMVATGRNERAFPYMTGVALCSHHMIDRTHAIGLAKNGAAIASMWFLYSVVRSTTAGAEQVARNNAELVLAWQQSVGLAIEPALQRWLLTDIVGVFANVYYLLHFPVTVALLIATCLWSRKHIFPILRDSLLVMTGVGLVLHLFFPLAPPRMLDGIIDASTMYGPNPYSVPGSEAANQFAAMPSMHVAWAIALGWTLFRISTRRSLWIIAMAHPLVTLFVVLVTGHHFLIDVVVGSLVGILAISLVSSVHQRTTNLDTPAQRVADTSDPFHTLSTG